MRKHERRRQQNHSDPLNGKGVGHNGPDQFFEFAGQQMPAASQRHLAVLAHPLPQHDHDHGRDNHHAHAADLNQPQHHQLSGQVETGGRQIAHIGHADRGDRGEKRIGPLDSVDMADERHLQENHSHQNQPEESKDQIKMPSPEKLHATPRQ